MTATSELHPLRAVHALRSVDPSTHEVLAVRASTSIAELDGLTQRAQARFRSGWAADGVERARCLSTWADAIEAEADELATLLMRETGKVRAEAQREVALSHDALRYNAGLCRHVDGAAATMADGSAVHLVRQPIGPSAFIVPWNWPLFLLMRDLGPGLGADTTALIKPSPQTPLAIARSRLQARSTRVGGKGVSIVFADADLERAVDTCVRSAFITSGKMCMASARLLVERSAYQQVLDAVCAAVDGLTVGPPEDPDADLGPLISRGHLERVWSYIELGRDRVATIGKQLAGDLAPGNYLAPTVRSEDLIREDLLRKIVARCRERRHGLGEPLQPDVCRGAVRRHEEFGHRTYARGGGHA
jgi:betaine-aldehyde dehydrogenase